ncbi:MAG TPA: autotransporter-associated beta strand repeat-containing protein, partial [Candidatus Anammoximicrobium sp.]|nr:autotransporter-associated beta strand repeat-containing protein [Candidatus Anammoximicrobium sp.]
MLEERRLLAGFQQVGSNLEITLNVASESVSIVSVENSLRYALTLNGVSTWTGTDDPGRVEVDTIDPNTLLVTADIFNAITIADANAVSGCAVTFADGGGNNYTDDFTIVLDDNSAGQIVFNGASEFSASSLSGATTANVVVSSGASLLASGGSISLSASTSQFQNLGTVNAGAGSVTITADTVDIQQAVTADGGITLQPTTLSRTIGLNDPAGNFNLTSAELGRLSSTGTVTIGADGGTGAVSIGGSGEINLSGKLFGLTLRGGDVTFAQRLRIISTKALTLRTGAVASAPGVGVDVQAGTLWLDTRGPVGASGNPLTLAVEFLRGTVGGNLFVREADGVTNSLAIANELDAGTNMIQLDGGTFNLGASNVIGGSSLVHVNGATLALGNYQDAVGGVRLTTGTISGTGTNDFLASATDFELWAGTVSAKLAGPVGMKKLGPGTVTLNDSGSTFTGATTISGGTLVIGAVANPNNYLGTPPGSPTPGHLVIDGATLSSGSLAISASRGIALGSAVGPGTGTINVTSGTVTYNGVMADNGIGGDQLIKTGPGILELGGVNTYSGGTLVNQGQIRISADSGLGTAPAVATPGNITLVGGTLRVRESFELAATRGIALGDPAGSGTGTIFVEELKTLTYNGVIADNGSGADTLIKSGTGALILGGDNTFSGGTFFADTSPSVVEGAIQINHPNALGTLGAITFNGTAILRYGPGITIDLSSRLVTGNSSVTAVIDTDGNDIAFGTELALIGGLEKRGVSTLTFTAAGQSNVGVLYVSKGELALPTGTLNVTGAASVWTYGPNSVYLRDAVLRINGGTLSTSSSVLAGITRLQPTLFTSWKLDISSGSLLVGGDLRTTLGVVAPAPDPALLTIHGATTQVDVAGNLTVGEDTDQYAHISAGTVSVTGDLIVGRNSNSVLDISGGTVTAASLRHENTDFGVVNLTGGVVTVGEVVLQTASITQGGLTVNLDVGGLLLTDRMYLDRTAGTTGTHTFEFRFDGGTLRPQSSGNLMDDIVVAPGAGGALFWYGVIEDGGALIDTSGLDANVLRPLLHDAALGMVSDGGLTKLGVGTLTLMADCGPDGFTGPATVVEDTLALVNTASNNIIAQAHTIDVRFGAFLDVTGLDNGPVTGTLILADGQTLTGEGTVDGKVIAGSGSTVAPGADTGVLIQNGDYSMDLGSSLNIQIGGNTPGNNDNQHDQMYVTGAVRLDGAALNVTAFNGYVPQLGDAYVIIRNDADDAVTGTFAGLPEGTVLPNFLGSGLSARITYVYDYDLDGSNNDVAIIPFVAPSIGIEKATNGEDADEAPGPLVLVGDTVTWSYLVTNTGNVALSNVVVTDDQGVTIGSPAGDDGNGVLDPGETWTYTASSTAVAGPYSNIGTVTANDAWNETVQASDPSHYFGVTPPGIQVEKSTNGEDADDAPGPLLAVGSLVTWTYTVTNLGNTPLANVAV